MQLAAVNSKRRRASDVLTAATKCIFYVAILALFSADTVQRRTDGRTDARQNERWQIITTSVIR